MWELGGEERWILITSNKVVGVWCDSAPGAGNSERQPKPLISSHENQSRGTFLNLLMTILDVRTFLIKYIWHFDMYDTAITAPPVIPC